MSQPDIAKLRALNAEMEAHQVAGTWTKEVFEEMLVRAEDAAGDQPDALEFILAEAQDAWLPAEDVADEDE